MIKIIESLSDIKFEDYETGEKIFNNLKDYLNSQHYIALDGNDWNWQPSDFNAQNLEPDGEIGLVDGTYITFYPYINKWGADKCKLSIENYNDLEDEVKFNIEKIFNKYKTDKWDLVYE